MSDIKENITVEKKKSTFMRKVMKVFLIFFIFLAVISVSLIILSQFKFFRHFALEKILTFVNKELIANIEIDDMTFFNPAGIKLYGVRVMTDGDTLANIPELTLNINLEQLLDQRVSVNRIVLKNPDIRLLRNSTDSLWNFDKIAFASEDTTTEPSSWKIKVKHLEFKNANFIYYDSTVSYINYGTMDYSHIHLENLDLILSADVKLAENDFAVNIRKLKTKEKYSQLDIEKFSAKLGVSPDLIYAKDFQAKINDSEYDINVEMKNYNVFSEIEPDLEKAEFDIALKGYNIGDEQISKFAVIPMSFGTQSDLLIDAKGTLNDLDLKRLNLIVGNSDIKISGILHSLLDMDEFEYALSLDKSVFTRSDIIKTLKSLDLWGIPDFGKAYAERLYVHGFIDSAYTDLELETNTGNITGKIGTHYGGNHIRYFADLDVQKINLEPILRNKSMKSNITGRVYVKGQGTDLDNLKTEIISELKNSEIYGYKFKNLSANINALNKIFFVNNLKLEFNKPITEDDPMYEYYGTPSIAIVGALDLNNMDSPAYKFNIVLNDLSIKSLTGINTMPDFVNAEFDIDMQGFDLDEINGKFSAAFGGLGFADRTFLPFSMEADFDITDSTNKKINIMSDFFKINIAGKFNFSSLIESLSLQGEYLGDFVSKKLESFNPQSLVKHDSISTTDKINRLEHFPDIEATLFAEISDMSPLNLFLDSLSIYSDIGINCQLISGGDISTLFIDSLKVDYFDFKTSTSHIKTKGVFFDGRIITRVVDSELSLENFVLNLDTTALLQMGELEISNLYTSINYDGSKANYLVGATVNNEIKFTSGGEVEIGFSDMRLQADSLKVSYKNIFNWFAPVPIIVNTAPNKIDIEQFEIHRKDAETISISGMIDNDVAKSLNLRVTDFEVTDFLKLTNEETRKQYAGAKFTLDSLRVRINGDLKEPRIITAIFADSLVFNNYIIGNLESRIIHNNTYIHGFVDITSPQLDNRKTLGIDINYLPVYLGTNPNIQLFDSTKQFDIRLKAMGLPLELISPFVVGVRDLSGFTDANLVVEGSLSKGIVYGGSIKTEGAKLNLESTNINYNFDLDVDFNKDKISLTNINLRNVSDDSRFGRLGSAKVTGHIDLKDFEVGELDIVIKADRLLVMSDNTMVTMPDLYGDFIVSTDYNALRFHGTLDKPNLDGDVNIIYGHLKMPLEQKRQAVRTYFTYQTVGDKVRIHSVTTNKDTTDTDDEVLDPTIGKSIADLINYNFTAKILGKFVVEMDMNVIGSMYAVIGTSDKSQQLRYEKRRDWEEAKLFGEVVLKEGSTIKSWKQLKASGTISFPTGSISNPTLNLFATHEGRLMEDDDPKQFIVKMHITGKKDNPKITLSYSIDGIEASGSPDQINEDALYLLVMGRTKSGGSSATNNNLLDEGFASGVSNFATKALSGMLMGSGVIQSAEFDFEGGSMDLGDATLRLSGQLYGGISWTIGGSVSDLSSNNQIMIEIPASEFSSNPFWSNFVLQLSKASSNNVVANSLEAKNWEVKVKFGSSW
jgi:hypothetical protein